MKNIFIINLLLISISISYSQKRIIDEPYQFVVIDSSSIDTSYNYIIVRKSSVDLSAKNWRETDGKVNLVLNKSIGSDFKNITSYGDIVLNQSDFNDFNSNEQLIKYVKGICAPEFSGYEIKYSVNGDINIDTIWYVSPIIGDTAFRHIIVWSSTIIQTSKWELKAEF